MEEEKKKERGWDPFKSIPSSCVSRSFFPFVLPDLLGSPTIRRIVGPVIESGGEVASDHLFILLPDRPLQGRRPLPSE